MSLALLAIPFYSAYVQAQGTTTAAHEEAFDALKGSKDGEPCKIIFKAEALSLCDEQLVPRKANVDYRYRDRTPPGNCNIFGWCVYQDHRFVIGWRPEGANERQSFSIAFRNLKAAEMFNKAMARWADLTPQEMSR